MKKYYERTISDWSQYLKQHLLWADCKGWAKTSVVWPTASLFLSTLCCSCMCVSMFVYHYFYALRIYNIEPYNKISMTV